ncbi:phosphonate degradation HD-domain oxygenase [Geitlerinema sp. PCC 9228]|uniref:phosphonate degradation HD-domain oxygenase n=1 Tax=Geitlerinema sp. PCC 9228 TaxID=111611 RepID=UPI001FCDBC75|nr:phosphonate degradation HD-domain oxygenase [Geitlerinema sp. PCC 9228]
MLLRSELFAKASSNQEGWPMNPAIAKIIHLLQTKGSQPYGNEAVSQLEHALQCATLAETNQAPPELLTAALLHDLGHLMHNLGKDSSDRGIDDRHEYCCLGMLRSIFPPAVTEPIRLHVEAKRYLCATEPQYWQELSAASQKSLKLQGDTFSLEQVQQFQQQPYAKTAVKLRRWDERAKVPGRKTPHLEHFIPYLEQAMLPPTMSFRRG